jgi:hypothetical protein
MSAAERMPPRWTAAALALVFALALALRLHGVRFGLPALNDPDELMFEMGSVRMLSGPTLNPGWFGHPATTTIYLLAVLNALVFAGGWLLGSWPSPKAFADMIYFDPGIAILPGRLAMVAIGLWSIWLTWRLARALAGERVGLAAAAVMAVNPLHIAYSQVIRSDLMAVCFMLLLSLAALRIARGGGRRDHVLASLWLGLAIVTKWPFAIGGLTVAGAYALLLWDRKVRLGAAVRGLAGFGVLALVFGLLASPFILLDYPTLLMNLAGEAQEHHLGASGGPPLANAGWYLTGPILASLGWAGALAAGWGAVLLVRRREGLAILLPPVVVFFVLFCLQRLIWERWALPLTPALSVAAGMGLVWLYDVLAARLGEGARRATLAVLALAVLAPQVVQASIETRVRTHDTRQAAAAWVNAHVPEGDTVLVEHFGFDMLQGRRHFLFPIGDAGCVDVRDLLAGKVQYDQIEEARHQRSNVDYGTLNPAKRATCGMHWAVLTQYDRYYAERATFPVQYAAYADLLRRGTIVASFAPQPGETGGPVVRIVKFAASTQTQAGEMPPLRR